MSAFPGFDSDVVTHSLTADGVTMRVVIQGEGPEVVFIPESNQTVKAFSSILGFDLECWVRLPKVPSLLAWAATARTRFCIPVRSLA